MIHLFNAIPFRSTPGVKFFDIGIVGSNACDLVEHSGPSISPPNKDYRKQFYVHHHQIDYNRVIKGERVFELFNPQWEQPHWFVYLNENAGALQIPVGCYHRSYSGKNGSLLINHAVRDADFSAETEFVPVTIDEDFSKPFFYGLTQSELHNFITNGRLQS